MNDARFARAHFVHAEKSKNTIMTRRLFYLLWVQRQLSWIDSWAIFIGNYYIIFVVPINDGKASGSYGYVGL